MCLLSNITVITMIDLPGISHLSTNHRDECVFMMCVWLSQQRFHMYYKHIVLMLIALWLVVIQVVLN